MCRACHYLCCEDRNEARCGCQTCPNPQCHCATDDFDEGEPERAPERHDHDAPPAMHVAVGFRDLC